jgi:hypothetical protein
VGALIVIGTTTIHDRRNEQTEDATEVVILADETVYALEYEDFEWSAEVLQRDAGRRDHLEQALDQLGDQ